MDSLGSTYMSIARLTDEPLDKMVSAQTAPKIYAAVVKKGLNFANTGGFPDGNNAMPQVRHTGLAAG